MLARLVAIVALLAAQAGLAQFVQAQPVQEGARRATGLELLPPGEYGELPKTPLYRAFIPDRVDLSARMPPVGDQGSQGSCVGWAVGYAARSYYSAAIDGRNVSRAANIASPAYIYDSIRRPEAGCDAGSNIGRALDLLRAGAVSHADYRYDEALCRRPPPDLAGRATDFRILDWLTLDLSRLDQVKAELAMGHPVVVSMAVRTSLYDLKGRAAYRARSGEHDGFHAVAVVGYDESRQAFRAINSWGPAWGDRGYFWFDYAAFASEVREAYVMRLPQSPPPPVGPDPGPNPAPHPEPRPQVAPEPVPTPPSPAPVALPEVACGRLELSGPAGGRRLSGFVGSAEEFETAAGFARDEGHAFEVDLYPWPQCEAVLTLGHARATDGPRLDGDRKRRLAEGDVLRIGLETPDADSFIHLAYIQADGSVLNLTPADMALAQHRPGSRVTLGDGAEGGAVFRVGAPFGSEMLIAVSSRSPLFADTRPPVETEREFLTALRQAMLYGGGGTPGRNIAATYQLIETAPKGGED